MSLLSRFLRKPEPLPHVIPRYHAATKAENKLATRRQADVRIELAIYAATTTPEQRRQEAERFFARAAKKRSRRSRASTKQQIKDDEGVR